MNQLEKRLTKLEPTSSLNTVRVIVIKGLVADNGRPAVPQPRAIAARNMQTGDTFAYRDEGEDEEAFERRACDLAEQRYSGISLITFVMDDKLEIFGMSHDAQSERNNHA